TVAEPGRRGAVREDMAEVAAAFGAMDLGPRHPVAAIARGADGLVADRLGEARPAGAAVELRVGLEERLAAGGADKGAAAFFLVQRARAARLGAVLAEHLVLLRRERSAPIVIGLLH